MTPQELFADLEKRYQLPSGYLARTYQIDDNKIAQSIKRSYRTSNPIWDRADMITSGIGQTHTRYNPAFAPMNFVRDAFTNAGIIGAEFDPITGGKLLTGMASDVANNGLARSLNFAKLYAEGKFDQIEKLAGAGKPYESLSSKERYYRDLDYYVKKGGRVSYLQGVAAKGALDQLIKEVGRSGILRTKDQIDKFIDIYNDMFELSSRVAAYRLLKDQYYHENLANKMSVADAQEDAKIRAVTYAKNLANFEQVDSLKREINRLQRGKLTRDESRRLDQLEDVLNAERRNIPRSANSYSSSSAKVYPRTTRKLRKQC